MYSNVLYKFVSNKKIFSKTAALDTWCNEELEALGLADREGENIRPPTDGLSIWEPKQIRKKHINYILEINWSLSWIIIQTLLLMQTNKNNL